MHRRATKIVATLGPASSDPALLERDLGELTLATSSH